MNTSFLIGAEEAQREKQKKLSDYFFLLAVIFGLILIFLEPPFVCPDENAHFVNICRIAHGGLFADVQDGAIGSYITEEELDYLSRYGGYYNGEWNTVRYDYSTMEALAKRLPSKDMIFCATPHAAINPTAYLLPAALVWLIRLFGVAVNAYNTVLLAKFANLLFYALVIRLAIRKTGAFSNSMFLLALMPMAIFQGASLSYDAFLIPASFLLFAYTTKLLRGDAVVSREDILAICFASACLFGAKIAYAPLVLILLSIPMKAFGSWKRWLHCVGLVATMGVVFYLLPTVIIGAVTREVPVVLTPEQLAQQTYLSEHWFDFPLVIYYSVKGFSGYWLESFVGILGWLDTYFPRAFLLLFCLIAAFNTLMDLCAVRGIRWSARLLSLAGFAIFFVGTLYTMYAEWNPILVGVVGGVLAYGGQGRYFIPVALFIVFAASNPLLERVPFRSTLERFRARLIELTALGSLTLTALLLLARYWL